MKLSRRGILASFLGIRGIATAVVQETEILKPPTIDLLPEPLTVPDLRATLTDGKATVTFPLLDVEFRQEMIEISSFAGSCREFLPGRIRREIVGLDLQGELSRMAAKWTASRAPLQASIGGYPVEDLRISAYGINSEPGQDALSVRLIFT